MRLRTFSSAVVFSMAAALAPMAVAQTGSVDAQIDIPFEFSIGKTVYQPAAYTVSLRTSGTQSLTLSQNGRHLMAMQILSRPGNGIRPISASSFLVFDVAQGQYHLSQIWMPEVAGFQVSTRPYLHKPEFVEARELTAPR